MNVQDLMTSTPRSIRGYENLGVAAAAMWEDDCGSLPVVDDANRVTAMITDRDICMALATRNRPASEIAVGEVVGRPPQTCAPNDPVGKAMEAMRIHQVRRLPVVDDYGRLLGIISINDLVIAAEGASTSKGTIANDDVVATLKGICGHADLPVVATTTTGAVVVSARKSPAKPATSSAKSTPTRGTGAKTSAAKATTPKAARKK